MKIENQVVSLELAKRLAELGVKGSALYSWCEGRGRERQSDRVTWNLYSDDTASARRRNMPTWAVLPAFTVAELGEMLWPRPELNKPYGITLRGVFKELYLHSEGEDSGYSHTDVEFIAEGTTEADARAKMLIHLIEKGLLKP